MYLSRYFEQTNSQHLLSFPWVLTFPSILNACFSTCNYSPKNVACDKHDACSMSWTTQLLSIAMFPDSCLVTPLHVLHVDVRMIFTDHLFYCTVVHCNKLTINNHFLIHSIKMFQTMSNKHTYFFIYFNLQSNFE